MKLKYYMRGLGIGIILTTLILSIGDSQQKLSEDEIKKQARELGMVMKEESNENLEDILKDLNPSVTPTLQPSTSPTVIPTPMISPEPTITIAPEPTKEPTLTPEPTKSADLPTDNTEGKVSFTINSGMSSGQVAALLVQKGLIEDAEDFNLYIVEQGKASVIRVGTYTVSADATYADIVKAITTRP